MPGSKEAIKKAKLAYRNRPAKLFTGYPRCPGCGSQCADVKSLETHKYFCESMHQKTSARRKELSRREVSSLPKFIAVSTSTS